MLLEKLRQVTKRIFDQPVLYDARKILLGGWPFEPTLSLLDSTGSDVILDVGCGTGHFSEKIQFRQYYGFDNDAKALQVATRRKVPNAVFQMGDIRHFNFQGLKPTQAILSGVLHHLSDDEAVRLLNDLAPIVSRWIVTEDPIYAQYHVLNNLLCRLDRGEHVRTEEEMLALIAKTNLTVEKKSVFYSNTRISKHIAFRLVP